MTVSGIDSESTGNILDQVNAAIAAGALEEDR